MKLVLAGQLLAAFWENAWVWLIVLAVLVTASFAWLLQPYRPNARRQAAEENDLEQEKETRHTTGGPSAPSDRTARARSERRR